MNIISESLLYKSVEKLNGSEYRINTIYNGDKIDVIVKPIEFKVSGTGSRKYKNELLNATRHYTKDNIFN